jgi:hypothetical protein
MYREAHPEPKAGCHTREMVVGAEPRPGLWCGLVRAGTYGVQASVQAYCLNGDEVLETVGLAGARWAELVEAMRGLPTVHEVELLESGPEGALVRMRLAPCPLARAIAASGALPQLPFDVEPAGPRWTVVASPEKCRRFAEALREEGARPRILCAREHEPRRLPLTPRQGEILQAAIRHGYYDYPRQISLTTLAQRLGIAKSTLAQSLMTAESRIMHERGRP